MGLQNSLGEMFRTNSFLETNIMSRNRISQIALTVALAIGVTGAASADEAHHILPQRVGVATALGGNASALIYWEDEADGIHVVTTINAGSGSESASGSQQRTLMRLSTLILPGQSQVIAIPGADGSQQQVLRIRRLSNKSGEYRIEVDRIADSQVRAQLDPATLPE